MNTVDTRSLELSRGSTSDEALRAASADAMCLLAARLVTPDALLIGGAQGGHAERVVRALQSGASEHACVWAVQQAAAAGHVDTLRTLLRDPRARAAKTLALGAAATHGHVSAAQVRPLCFVQ